MATRIFTFTTPELDEDLVLPVAKELGYKETTEAYETFTNQTELVDGAINIQNFTQEDGTVLYSYNTVTEVPNPQTIDEFVAQYFKIEFLRNKIMPAIIKVQTATLEAEKVAKEKELEEAKKAIEASLITN